MMEKILSKIKEIYRDDRIKEKINYFHYLSCKNYIKKHKNIFSDFIRISLVEDNFNIIAFKEYNKFKNIFNYFIWIFDLSEKSLYVFHFKDNTKINKKKIDFILNNYRDIYNYYKKNNN